MLGQYQTSLEDGVVPQDMGGLATHMYTRFWRPPCIGLQVSTLQKQSVGGFPPAKLFTVYSHFIPRAVKMSLATGFSQ